jgi:hypothetical protein
MKLSTGPGPGSDRTKAITEGLLSDHTSDGATVADAELKFDIRQ